MRRHLDGFQGAKVVCLLSFFVRAFSFFHLSRFAFLLCVYVCVYMCVCVCVCFFGGEGVCVCV